MNWIAGLPEGWRLFRIGWRKNRVIVAGGVSAVICFIILAFVLLTFEAAGEKSGDKIATALCWSYFILHLILVYLVIPVNVASSMTDEWKLKTWVFQQTTPQHGAHLAVGKLLGGPADIYISVLAVLPFLLISVLSSSYSFVDFIVGYLMTLLVSLLLSSIILYISVLSDQLKKGASGVRFAFVIIVFWYAASAISAAVRGSADGSAANLGPLAMINYMFFDREFSVVFFGLDLPAVPAALVFYLAWTLWFVLAASAQINHRRAILFNRLPLAGMFIFTALLIFGFTGNWRSWFINEFGRGSEAEQAVLTGTAFVFVLIFLLMLYGVMQIHRRSREEIRPWLYQWQKKPGGLLYYFRSDSPVIFTALLLCLITLAGIFYIAFLISGIEAVALDVNWLSLAAMFLIIVLRDCLFYQYWQLRFPKRKVLFVIIYIIGFLAVPNLINLAAKKYILDLFPSAVFIAIMPGKATTVNWPLTYFLNLALLVFFVVVNFQLISGAYRRLPPELSRN